ncbi:hypothetical protein SEPCBS119000_002842 [Sporothrix epigloea]|uniref:Uncharacterized protein n=1 Tax=Sporothrix epigloea TaxID=1892477 RepID=A0ABP0DIF1_9PEZI
MEADNGDEQVVRLPEGNVISRSDAAALLTVSSVPLCAPPCDGWSFRTKKDCLDLLNVQAKHCGYRIRIRRTSRMAGPSRKVDLCCDRAGQYVNHGKGIRRSKSKKTDCKWSAALRYNEALEPFSMELSLDYTGHNHSSVRGEPAPPPDEGSAQATSRTGSAARAKGHAKKQKEKGWFLTEDDLITTLERILPGILARSMAQVASMGLVAAGQPGQMTGQPVYPTGQPVHPTRQNTAPVPLGSSVQTHAALPMPASPMPVMPLPASSGAASRVRQLMPKRVARSARGEVLDLTQQ